MMIRRAISLLLVPMLLLQGMSFAHSHGGTGVYEPPGHDHTPHVHWYLFATPAHQHHEDQDHVQDADDDDDGDVAADPKTPATDHDDDALYVSVSLMLGWPGYSSQAASHGVSSMLAVASLD